MTQNSNNNNNKKYDEDGFREELIHMQAHTEKICVVAS